MARLILFAMLLALLFLIPFEAQTLARPGYIYLQVEERGEAWYVNPANGKRYSLGSGEDAYAAMSGLGLGISNADLERVYSDPGFVKALAGRILLQVEEHGEAFYVSPRDLKVHYLRNGNDAYFLMRLLGVGITNTDLHELEVGSVPKTLNQEPSSVTENED